MCIRDRVTPMPATVLSFFHRFLCFPTTRSHAPAVRYASGHAKNRQAPITKRGGIPASHACVSARRINSPKSASSTLSLIHNFIGHLHIAPVPGGESVSADPDPFPYGLSRHDDFTRPNACPTRFLAVVYGDRKQGRAARYFRNVQVYLSLIHL